METKNYMHCKIKEINGVLSGVGGTNRKLYEIKHDFTNEILHGISESEAFRIARLLDLESEMVGVKEHFWPEDFGYE